MNVSNGFKRALSIIFSIVAAFILGPLLDNWGLKTPGSQSSFSRSVGLVLFLPFCMFFVGIVTYFLLSNIIRIFFQRGQIGEQKTVLKPVIISIVSIIAALTGTGFFVNIVLNGILKNGINPFLKAAGFGFLLPLGIVLYFLFCGILAATVFVLLVIFFQKTFSRFFNKKSNIEAQPQKQTDQQNLGGN